MLDITLAIEILDGFAAFQTVTLSVYAAQKGPHSYGAKVSDSGLSQLALDRLSSAGATMAVEEAKY